jgi:hypothetical protein
METKGLRWRVLWLLWSMRDLLVDEAIKAPPTKRGLATREKLWRLYDDVSASCELAADVLDDVTESIYTRRMLSM